MIDEDILIEEEISELVNSSKEKQIVVYNDDYNTFDHVIECFVKYCKHQRLQAEQCANIIHNNGKCSVKKGSLKDLKPINEALCENGLNARIE